MDLAGIGIATRLVTMTRLIAQFLAVIIIIVCLPVTPLTFIARTSQGRLAGWVAVSAILASVMAMLAFRSPSRIAIPFIAAGFAALVAGLAITLLANAPASSASRKTGLLSVFPNPDDFHRRSVWNLIPEVDAVTLGAAILTRVDPWMSTTHARRIRSVLDELYSEMSAEPENNELGGVADYAAAELFRSPFRSATHYYAYIPAHDADERLGMVVFLHGNAGNHKVMAWAWKSFADRNKVAIICPTFGFGFWDDGGVEAVERAYQHAVNSFPIDTTRVWLGGMSDGGKGVTRSAIAHPEHYRGLVYLSPTMIVDEVGGESFLSSWKGRRVLDFQGVDDHNVLERDVAPAVELMRRGGVSVTYETFTDEDHFLFFARRAEIFQRIGNKLEVID